MRKITTLLALVILAACESATGAERAASAADAGPAMARSAASGSVGIASTPRLAIVSVRRKVQGTMGLYAARAAAVDGGEVTIEVRSSTTAFLNLTSGNLETIDAGTGAVDVQFQTDAGKRYLVIAYPSTGGTVDPAGAAYAEAVP